VQLLDKGHYSESYIVVVLPLFNFRNKLRVKTTCGALVKVNQLSSFNYQAKRKVYTMLYFFCVLTLCYKPLCSDSHRCIKQKLSWNKKQTPKYFIHVVNYNVAWNSIKGDNRNDNRNINE
jgi:hypothetical protein